MNKLNIEPIKLLRGTHNDTDKTGSGCFMNVIAYLNGESQITDQSPCVCSTIRPIVIWINDYLNDDERYLLIPFVHRAMGTATDDNTIVQKRLDEVVRFANDMAAIARHHASTAHAAYAASAAHAARSAAAAAQAAYVHARAAYVHAADAVAQAAASASHAAAHAARSDSDAYLSNGRKEIIERSLAFMDAVCPPADTPTQVLIERANRLLELARSEPLN